MKKPRSADKFQDIRDKVLPVLLPYGVRRIAIFGSYVRGESTDESDIDLLVTMKPRGQRPPMGLRWFGLENELTQLVGRKVELISEKALSPYIRPYVEREMVILYEEG
ncbi:MAG: nucleotidyltransferase family protein [candidate division WOR-3 bacterium]